MSGCAPTELFCVEEQNTASRPAPARGAVIKGRVGGTRTGSNHNDDEDDSINNDNKRKSLSQRKGDDDKDVPDVHDDSSSDDGSLGGIVVVKTPTRLLSDTQQDTMLSTVSLLSESKTSIRSTIVSGDIESAMLNSMGGTQYPRKITYEYVQNRKKPNPDEMKKELMILGIKDVSNTVLGVHLRASAGIREAILLVTSNRFKAKVVAQAQENKIVYKGRYINLFTELGEWWASLSEEEAVNNAECMFNIQQLPFDDGTWAKEVERDFMRTTGLEYHVTPNQLVGTTGSMEQIVNRQRINLNRILTRPCKRSTSHGRYISVKLKPGTKKLGRRKFGCFQPWMLQSVKDGDKHDMGVVDVRQVSMLKGCSIVGLFDSLIRVCFRL
jgi:hypothetical protein